MKRLLRKLQRLLPKHRREQTTIWEYKVVQMVSENKANPKEASRKLGGSLSAEALRNQFPEYYNKGNSRAQICKFLNTIGQDGWELIQIQQIGKVPMMILKRPLRSPSESATNAPQNQGSD